MSLVEVRAAAGVCCRRLFYLVLHRTCLPYSFRCQVGPRGCLNPIKVFAGSFNGSVLYDNANYVSPNEVRLQSKSTAPAYACSACSASLTSRAHRASSATRCAAACSAQAQGAEQVFGQGRLEDQAHGTSPQQSHASERVGRRVQGVGGNVKRATHPSGISHFEKHRARLQGPAPLACHSHACMHPRGRPPSQLRDGGRERCFPFPALLWRPRWRGLVPSARGGDVTSGTAVHSRFLAWVLD